MQWAFHLERSFITTLTCQQSIHSLYFSQFQWIQLRWIFSPKISNVLTYNYWQYLCSIPLFLQTRSIVMSFLSCCAFLWCENVTNMGVQTWLSSEEHWLFFQRTLIHFPAPTWQLQLFLTPIPWDFTPSHRHTQRQNANVH